MLTTQEKRTTYVQLRVTETEKRQWKSLADERGERLSDVVRAVMNRIPRADRRHDADH
jgi:antitoxin component of RelBE/YafQ-DinJ toxin-antitoxin module